MALNEAIAKQEAQLVSLNALKNSLVRETNELNEVYNSVKLQNYELEC